MQSKLGGFSCNGDALSLNIVFSASYANSEVLFSI